MTWSWVSISHFITIQGVLVDWKKSRVCTSINLCARFQHLSLPTWLFSVCIIVAASRVLVAAGFNFTLFHSNSPQSSQFIPIHHNSLQFTKRGQGIFYFYWSFHRDRELRWIGMNWTTFAKLLISLKTKTLAEHLKALTSSSWKSESQSLKTRSWSVKFGASRKTTEKEGLYKKVRDLGKKFRKKPRTSGR